MAKKKATAESARPKSDIVEQAAPATPKVEVVVDYWPGHDNRGLYISSMKSDVPIPWGHTAVVVVVDGDTGEVVDATLAVRQTDQRDVRVVDARVVSTFNQCLYAVTGAVEVSVVVRVDAKSLMGLAEVYQANQFTKQIEELRKVIFGMLTGDTLQSTGREAMVIEEQYVDGEAVAEASPAPAKNQAPIPEAPADDEAPFDDAPILDFIEAKDVAAQEEPPAAEKPKRSRRKAKEPVVEEVVFEEANEEPVEEEPVEDEEAVEDEEGGFDPESQYMLNDGEIVDKTEFTEEPIDMGDGAVSVVYWRGGRAYMLEAAPLNVEAEQWLAEVSLADEPADDNDDTDEGDSDDNEAVYDEDTDDEEGYETVVPDDESDEDDGGDIVDDEEVTLDPVQQATYDAFMGKVEGYDIQNLYSIANRNGVKSAELTAAFKAKDKAAMLQAISDEFISILLSKQN